MKSIRFSSLIFVLLCAGSTHVHADWFAATEPHATTMPTSTASNTQPGKIRPFIHHAIWLGPIIARVSQTLAKTIFYRQLYKSVPRPGQDLTGARNFIQNQLVTHGLNPQQTIVADRDQGCAASHHKIILNFPELQRDIDQNNIVALDGWRWTIAHEIGHVKHYDFLKGALYQLGAGLVTHLAWALLPVHSCLRQKNIKMGLLKAAFAHTIKQIFRYIDENRADAYANETLRNHPAVLKNAARFWSQKHPLLLNAAPSLPMLFFDSHSSLIERVARMLTAAGLPTTWQILQQRLAASEHLDNARHTQLILIAFKIYARSNELSATERVLVNIATLGHTLVQALHDLNHLMQHMQPAERQTAHYFIQSLILKLRTMQDLSPAEQAARQQVFDTFEHTFAGIGETNPVALYIAQAEARQAAAQAGPANAAAPAADVAQPPAQNQANAHVDPAAGAAEHIESNHE